MSKKKRGGARPNSGPKPGAEKVPVNRRLQKKPFEALKKKARRLGISDTEGINKAIIEWTKAEQAANS